MRVPLAALLVSLLAFAAAPPARAEEASGPTIELFTMGPGEAIPERFGHAALCVRHPEREGADRCYDYGAFDASNLLSLGYRFLRGESVFFVAVRDPDSMIRHYKARDRTVWRQTLPLSREQAARAQAILEEDARPENRTYHYHHYSDNCSTRVRDILDEVTAGALASWRPEVGDSRTFRDFTREGFAGLPALLAASELILGRAVDERPDAYERMFLPKELRRAVREALGVEAKLVYAREAPPFPEPPSGGSPLFPIAGFALFVALTATAIWGRGEGFAVGVASVPLSLLGMILWAVAIVSPLPEVRLNELLLVFVPTDIALPFLSLRRRYRYALVRLVGIALAALLSIAGVFVQPLINPLTLALLPLAAFAMAPGWKAWRAQRRSRQGSAALRHRGGRSAR